MKIASSELFELIHALSPSEKRYISRMALDQDTSFLKLMNAIAKQKVYDEQKLKRDFKDSRFIKNLAVNKQYLYDYIVSQLVQYRKKDEEMSILQSTPASHILLEKGLYQHAKKRLDRQIKKSEALGLYHLSLQLLSIKKRTLRKDYEDREVEEIYFKEKEIRELIENTNEYWYIFSQVYNSQLKYRKAPTEERRISLEAWLRHSMIYDFNNATTIESQLYFHETKALLFSVLDKKEDAFISNWKYIKTLDDNPKYLSRLSEKYVHIYLDLIKEAKQLDKDDFFKEGLETLRNISDSSLFKITPPLSALIFKESYLLEFKTLNDEGKSKQAIELLPRIEEGIKLHQNQIPNLDRFSLIYYSSYFLFQEKKYQDAIDWISPLLNYKKLDINHDIMLSSRVVNLISNFEIGNKKEISNIIKTTRRYIKQYRALLNSEKQLFSFLESAIKSKIPSQTRMLSLQLLEQLVIIKSSPNEKKNNSVFNMLKWCEKRMD